MAPKANDLSPGPQEEPKPTRGSSGLDDTVPAASATGDNPISEPPPPDQRYRLGDELGRGGMGRVVEAFDTHLGRSVALKEVLPKGGASVVRRFQREVQITARLEHASIVPLYDSGVMHDGRPFYVMRRVSGRPLDELVARARGLEDRLALLPNVLAAVDAVAHAHRRGVIHRDLKPANILVGELGETVVIDWGLAKVIGEDDLPPDSIEPFRPSAADSLKTQLGSVFGTPGFMSPEQASGDEPGTHSDVFALGATLYTLLAGRPPVSGTSATDVIVSTLQHRIVPIATACPTAPAELVTIIDKALELEPKNRYPNAGELAEDLRRFTTGQLVAAHRYTRRQRLARFARRHRAVLSVAALASVAVAALAWFSVHRIIKERDFATHARGEAELQRLKADTKVAELRERGDQLVLMHARGLLDRSPTEAIAVLKRIERTSTVLDEAKAIAKSAIARGVAWGVEGLPGFVTSFELTRDGKRLLQFNRAGRLQVIDLDLRRAIVTHDFGLGSTGLWVAGDRKILVARATLPPTLFDVATGTNEPIDAGPISISSKTTTGDFVAFVDKGKNVGLINIVTKAVTPLATTGTAANDLAIAHDGSFIAFSERIDKDRWRLVVVDRTGRVMLQRPGRVVMMTTSAGGKLAVSFYEQLFEVKPIDPAPMFDPVPLPIGDARTAHWLVYRGELLHIVAAREVLGWNGKQLTRSEPLSNVAYLAMPAADNVLIATANDNAIHVLRDGTHLTLPLTGRPHGAPRVAVSPGVSRFAALANDTILVWDTADLLPKMVDAPAGVFVDNRRVAISKMIDWEWIDLDSGARETVEVRPLGLFRDLQASEDGRTMIVLSHDSSQQPTTTAVVITPDLKRKLAIAGIADGHVQLVANDGVVYSPGKGRVLAKLGDAAPRELVVLDGDVGSLASNGPNGFAALSKAGDLVKGSLDGTNLERVRIDIARGAFVVCDPERNVLIAAGNRLMRWRGDVDEVARFAADSGSIEEMTALETGILISLTNKQLFFLPTKGDQTPRRVSLSPPVVVATHGKLIAGLSAAMQIEIVELPSLATWSLPRLFTGMSQISVSPDGRRIVQGVGGRMAMWRLPQASSEYPAWLEEVTNATEADGHLMWPWQLPSP